MGSRYWIPALLLCLPLASPGAGDAPLDRATLRGLKAVNIVLDPLDPELQKAGLTRTDLQTRIEQKLRAANIDVNSSAPEFVGLRVTSVHGGKGAISRGQFAVAFDLAVYQPVTLVRDKNIRSATATWEIETVVIADPRALQQAASESIDDLAGRLAAAWRSVNPN